MSEEQNAPPAGFLGGMDPDTLAALGIGISEFSESLLAQLEQIARVNFAKAFLGPPDLNNRNRDFDTQGFERAWAYLQGDTLETPPQ